MQVAAEAVQRFGDGSAQITAHHGSVTSKAFDVAFFRKFDVVLNGLDNYEARYSVNRKCLAAGTPLVESGSAGLVGQVTVHVGGRTACYECDGRPQQKSYPICTIRNTPEKPIHCIVWAKDLLFEQLFGETETTDLAEQQQHLHDDEGFSPSTSNESAKPFERRKDETVQAYAQRIYKKVFVEDIKRVRMMEELWAERSPPSAIELEQDAIDSAQRACSEGKKTATALLHLNNAHEVWSQKTNQEVFLLSLQRLAQRKGKQYFDKDDDDAVQFVVAASNLRASNYGIEKQSLFDAKGMAGNIVHAVSTTNAILAGLMVLEAVKLANHGKQAHDLRRVWVNDIGRHQSRAGCGRKPESTSVLQGDTMHEPNAGCYACNRARLRLKLDTSAITLRQLIDVALRKHLRLSSPIVNIGSAAVYEEGDDLDSDEVEQYRKNAQEVLCNLPGGGVSHGTRLAVQDLQQEFECEVVVEHTGSINPDEVPEQMLLEGAEEAQQQQAQQQQQSEQADGARRGKRKRGDEVEDTEGVIELDESNGSASKAAKQVENNDDAMIVLE